MPHDPRPPRDTDPQRSRSEGAVVIPGRFGERSGERHGDHGDHEQDDIEEPVAGGGIERFDDEDDNEETR